MRKRFFFPLFILLGFFPVIVYLLSYTRFFNDEVRDILETVVDDGTNAQLRLGVIHGSVFGTFRIDGAALIYDGQPIALVDTVVVAHFPLTIAVKTVQILKVKLVHPRFHLVRYMDGTFNVDRIGKPGGKGGGKFDWTILAKSVEIVDGEMTMYDSLAQRSAAAADRDSGVARFSTSNFRVSKLDLSASADFSGDNLSANVEHMSMVVDPPGMKINSLKFDFFTSRVGTEVSGLVLRSGRSVVHVDVALKGQNLLDSLNENTIRGKYFTASVRADNADVKQVDGFVKLPIDKPSKFNVDLFASGTLDAFKVKQCFVSTDSSFLPMAAEFRNVLDSTMTMDVKLNNGGVDMKEVSSVLRHLGVPDAGRLGRMSISASAAGRPADLIVTASLGNEGSSINGESRFAGKSYSGGLTFRGVNLADILNLRDFETSLTGSASFSMNSGAGHMPDGSVSVHLDSSWYNRIAVRQVTAVVTSLSDSIGADFNVLTSSGNADGQAGVNTSDQTYAADIHFSELNPAPFVRVPTLEGDLTGRLVANGSGFDLDSMMAQASLLTERSTLDSLDLGTSAFAAEVNTRSRERVFRLHSPYFDAALAGHFVPHEMPALMSGFASALIDSFVSRLTGRRDSIRAEYRGLPVMDASADISVKDARLIGQIIGNTDLSGGASARVRLVSDVDSVAVTGSLSTDSLSYVHDSVNIAGTGIDVGFNYKSDRSLSAWDSGAWSINGGIGSLDIGPTRLVARELNLDYASGKDSERRMMRIKIDGGVDTLVSFNLNATATLTGNKFDIFADTLGGDFYGVPMASASAARIEYSAEKFNILPTIFRTDTNPAGGDLDPQVTVEGSYSLVAGADLRFRYRDFGLRSIQRIARLDTNSLKVAGHVSGNADLSTSAGGLRLSVDYSGNDIYYNGSVAKLLKGKIGLNGQVISIDAELSKEDDPAVYALRLDGTIPLSARSTSRMRLNLQTDSLDISFLTPFLPGIEDFGGILTGNITVSGRYASPEMNGRLDVSSGKIRLAANEVEYLYDGTLIGKGDRLQFDPLTIRNVFGQTGGTMIANGYIVIGQNTIQEFNLSFDGSLLVLNTTARRTVQGMYGTAIVGSGSQGLTLRGSLRRPMLLGSLSIRSADLTLLHLQRSENMAAQEIIYHIPLPPSDAKIAKMKNGTPSPAPVQASGSFIDSLRYDLEIETRDNMNLRLIFDPTTNEELSAVLGGRLHMSNLGGSMELMGDVSVQNNSYYNFYGRHFAATGKLHFTGNPLNPIMDITAQYSGEHSDTASSASGMGNTKSVVVQLGITGTFDKPNPPDISMTVDGVPWQGDVQTNAISFILTNEFADELTSSVRRSVADNLAGAGILAAGTSILSGALTNLFSKEFTFIRSAELRYSSISDLANPDVAITSQFGKATIRLGGQVFSDINNTDFSLDYPLTYLLGNMLYLQLSHKIALNNRTYYQRETINALKLFYQLSF